MRLNLQQAAGTSGQLRDWAYNALDCTGTREIWDNLHPRLSPMVARTYAFERALQAPFMAMMREGVLVDVVKRNKRSKMLSVEADRIVDELNAHPTLAALWDMCELETGICDPEIGSRHKWPKGVPDAERKCERCGVSRMRRKPFNPGSSQQKIHLFYGLLKCKPVYGKNKKITCDDEAMQSIGRNYPKLADLTGLIDKYQKTNKQIGFLNGRLTPNNRYLSSFNVGTAWTGRASSSKNPYGLGGNLQNIAERNRDIFIADEGWEICYADLEQAESNTVAHIAEDEEYIAAHLSGDVHTFVARIVWPTELEWTGDLAKDKKIAKANPPWDLAPGHEYRFQCKKIQHGSNYGLTPFGMAILAHIPRSEAQKAQRRYFDGFPGIPRYQNRIRKELAEHLPLISPLKRRFKLFGRPDDEHTFKQALAVIPQSVVADVLDLAIWRIYYELGDRVRLLAQVHDAILFLVRKGDSETKRRVLELMSIPVVVGPRTMRIGTEMACGLNWGKKSQDNPDGLETWNG